MNTRIVFIGGSITEGVGATSYEVSYTGLLGKYFNEKFGNVDIINAGASGTSSHFALFRLDKDVVSYKPDIVFIEFAVNDRIEDSRSISIYFENMIRKLLMMPKQPQIVILVMPTELGDACGGIHKKISYYYNIPVIDIQDYIWRLIGNGQYRWSDISIDSLHPNDLGHKIYSEYIIECCEKEKDQYFKTTNFKNNPLMQYEFNNPRIENYEQAIFYGHWKEESLNLSNRMKKAAVSDYKGDCIEFSFRGRYIAITTIFSEDCGILELSVDGKDYFVDLYRELKDYFTLAINIDDLTNCEHRLVLRVSDEKNPQSKGNRIVIGGFLVEG